MVTTSLAPSSADDPLAYRPVALVDLLDRVLATGVVISGDITLAIADIDLVRISLRALVASIRPGMEYSRATEADARASERPG